MLHRTRMSMVVAALAAATALGGCGSKNDDKAAATPAPAADTAAAGGATTAPGATPAPKVPAEYASWAKSFCSAMTADAAPIQPPNVQAGSAEASQKSLANFFDAVVQQQEKQLAAFKQAGPPPAAEATWKKAQRELQKVHDKLETLSKTITGKKVATESDVKELIATLRKPMTSLGSYQGPIAQLQANSKIGPALAAEPSCTATS